MNAGLEATTVRSLGTERSRTARGKKGKRATGDRERGRHGQSGFNKNGSSQPRWEISSSSSGEGGPGLRALAGTTLYRAHLSLVPEPGGSLDPLSRKGRGPGGARVQPARTPEWVWRSFSTRNTADN
ncbi:hypothetical protein MTO96_020777 [Rhipicephalus appendiculatus]